VPPAGGLLQPGSHFRQQRKLSYTTEKKKKNSNYYKILNMKKKYCLKTLKKLFMADLKSSLTIA
jgi:hypothetical protein